VADQRGTGKQPAEPGLRFEFSNGLSATGVLFESAVRPAMAA